MKIALGRLGLDFPDTGGLPAYTSHPSNNLYVPEYGVFGVVQGITGRDPAKRYADYAAKYICDGIVAATRSYSEIAFRELQRGPEILRQLIVAGGEALISMSEDAGGPLILSKTAASVAVAHLQGGYLDFAYIGGVRVRLIRSNKVEFSNKPHTLGEMGEAPPWTKNVLIKELRIPQDLTAIDVQRAVVQSSDIILMSTLWMDEEVINDIDWVEYSAAIRQSFDRAAQQLETWVKAHDLFSRISTGAAWVLVLVE